MTQVQILFISIACLCLASLSILVFSFYLKNLNQQVERLKKQVYYWSRQIPVNKRGRRPKNKSAVIHDRR